MEECQAFEVVRMGVMEDMGGRGHLSGPDLVEQPSPKGVEDLVQYVQRRGVWVRKLHSQLSHGHNRLRLSDAQ